MRIYINRNLWQYERSFNPTSTASRFNVDPSSSHHHHLRPLQLNSLPTTRNYPARRPSPLLRDMGPIENAPRKYRNTDPSHIRPSPLQRDVGGSMTLDGRDEHEGKPKQCEAHLARHKSEPRPKSWFGFIILLFLPCL